MMVDFGSAEQTVKILLEEYSAWNRERKIYVVS
jgi:hypothetical protein